MRDTAAAIAAGALPRRRKLPEDSNDIDSGEAACENINDALA